MSEQEQMQPIVERRVSWTSRFGCFFGVILWSILMLIPGFFCVLAFQGEIALWHGSNIPDPTEHPVIQVKLISEIDASGLIITRSYVATDADDNVCVESDISYLLWDGADENQNVKYCQCYLRVDDGVRWLYQGSTSGACGR